MAKDRSKIQKKIDRFARYVFLTEDGKPKSASMLYAFCLAILFFAIYVACYGLALWIANGYTDPETSLLNIPVALQIIFLYILPAVVGTLPCLCMFFALKKHPEYVPLAYNWMAFFLLILLIGVLLWCDTATYWSDFYQFCLVFGFQALLATGVGYAASHLIYDRIQKTQDNVVKQKKRPSYYNT